MHKIDAPASPPGFKPSSSSAAASSSSYGTGAINTAAMDLLAAFPNLRPAGLGPVGVMRTTSVGPSLGMPPMIRSTSNGRSAAPPAAPAGSLYANPNEWRSFVAIEERSAVRSKISDAYKKACPTYQELLEMVMAVDEELLFASAPTRLEYFKSAIEWENRLLIKRKQLSGQIGSGLADAAASAKRKANGAPATPTVDAKVNTAATAAASTDSDSAPVVQSASGTAPAAAGGGAAVGAAAATTPGGHPLVKKLRVDL